MDEIAVYRINAGDGDAAEMIFDFNGLQMDVSIFPSPSAQDQKHHSLVNRLIDLLGRATSPDADGDEYEEIEDEVLGVILDAGRPIFREAAPLGARISPCPSPDLHSLLFPKTLTFRLLETGSGNAAVVPIDPAEAYIYYASEGGPDGANEDDFDIDTSLPQHSTREIFILDKFAQGAGHVAGRVRVDCVDMFCKAQGRGRHLIDREMACLQDIHRLCRPDANMPIRVPQFLGYVRHADKGCNVGFLRQWVPGSCLRDVDMAGTSAARRRKWASQIRETVDRLHAMGLIWGDGKASNIVIDEGDDAWLIDFGGWFTKGWVDEQLADTVEGDEQAIRNIMAFLRADQEI